MSMTSFSMTSSFSAVAQAERTNAANAKNPNNLMF